MILSLHSAEMANLMQTSDLPALVSLKLEERYHAGCWSEGISLRDHDHKRVTSDSIPQLHVWSAD